MGVSLYPNLVPTTARLLGTAPGDQITLYSVAGQSLATYRPRASPVTLDVAWLPGGGYLLRVWDASGRLKGNIPVLKR